MERKTWKHTSTVRKEGNMKEEVNLLVSPTQEVKRSLMFHKCSTAVLNGGRIALLELRHTFICDSL